jgi:hypothetical protein
MLGSGLREVSNPSEILFRIKTRIIWDRVASTLEGMRPDDEKFNLGNTAV